MDRRVVAAILLMMAIAIVPGLFMKRPPPRRPVDSTAVTSTPLPEQPAPAPAPVVTPVLDSTAPATAPERVIPVSSSLYTYGISTRGARIARATLHRYQSLAPGERGQDVQFLPDRSNLLGLRLVVGRDTLSLQDWDFTPSSESVRVEGPARLTLTSTRGGVTVELTYGFDPDRYLVDVRGRVTGLGPNGGTLLIAMGPGLRNVEADSADHVGNLGVVTKAAQTDLTRFGKLDRDIPTELSGPFEWVAVKSKYFVTAVFAVDTLESGRTAGRITGVRAFPLGQARQVSQAEVLVSTPVPAAGTLRYALYAGPMEYPRLKAVGNEFDDVNPYGWPGFRTIIRPVAVAGRWLLVWMHEGLGIAYGMGLVLFGIMVRVALWPLNQKAMRSSMAMQAVQPLLKELQDKYKNDPQKLQQEMFKLYKEHNVNPLGGCWPMLLPMPVLIALFFVFQNTIELRGAPFLWLSDLSRPDPLYIIPVVMGLSMYLVSKIGQLGMAPNPQMKMMLYVMPAMMTFLFLNFASGLNLYYAVQNLASIPQQWMLAKERMRRAG